MFEQNFKNIDDVLRKAAGCTTELDYTEQTSWFLILKYLDLLERDREIEAELRDRPYAPIRSMIDAEQSDLFDLLTYIAHNRHPLKRSERADRHLSSILSSHDPKQQAFFNFVLPQYVVKGEAELDMDKLPTWLALKYGSPTDAVHELGSVVEIRNTFRGFQRQLYVPTDGEEDRL